MIIPRFALCWLSLYCLTINGLPTGEIWFRTRDLIHFVMEHFPDWCRENKSKHRYICFIYLHFLKACDLFYIMLSVAPIGQTITGYSVVQMQGIVVKVSNQGYAYHLGYHW